MSTRDDNLETLALRAAFDAFSETLSRKLQELGKGGALAALDHSRHVHVSMLVGGETTFVVRTEVLFSSDAGAVELALQFAKHAVSS